VREQEESRGIEGHEKGVYEVVLVLQVARSTRLAIETFFQSETYHHLGKTFQAEGQVRAKCK
jgi:hypothetical protein